MPLIAQLFCDQCNVPKKETNHWFKLLRHDQSVCIEPLDDALLHAIAPSASQPQYLCSRFCLFQALSEWMDDMGDCGPRKVTPSEAVPGSPPALLRELASRTRIDVSTKRAR